MKFGHFIAIILFFITIISGFLFYLDLQDGTFSSKLLFSPIFFTYLMIIFLIYPGSKLETDKEVNFLENVSSKNINAILAGFAVTLYFYFWIESLFTRNIFFTINHQVSLLLSFIIIFLIIKWQVKKPKK